MKIRHLLVGFLIIIWVVTIISAYYVVHRPSSPGSAPHIHLALVDLIVALALASIAGGLGVQLLGGLDLDSPLEGATVQLAMGVGTLGLLMFALGIAGLLISWLIILLVIAGVILLRKNIWRWYQGVAALQGHYQRSGIFGRIMAWAIVLVLSLSLLLSLAPPTKWDSLVYHLELPKQYLQAGKIIFLPDNQFVGTPQLVELNFAAAMALRDGASATTYGWVVGIIALLGVSGLAGRLIGPKAVFLAPIILLTGESLAEGLSWGYADTWLMLFSVSALISLDHFSRTRERKHLIVAGVMAGFSASVKYTGALVVLLGVAWLAFDEFRKNWASRRTSQEMPSPEDTPPLMEDIGSIRHFLQGAITILLLAIIVFSPWIVKNYVFTNNPIYPYFFEGGGIDQLRQSFYFGIEPQRTLVNDLLLPWDATVFGDEDSSLYSSSIGPLMLAFIPAFLLTAGLKRRRHDELHNLILIALLGWVVWAIGSHVSSFLSSPRLYYSVFPAFAVLACAGFESLTDIEIPKIRIQLVVQALTMLAVVLALFSMTMLVVERNPVPVVIGNKSQDEYLFQSLGWYKPVINEVNSLEPESKTLFLWESRAFYCENLCSPDVVIDRWWYFSRSIGDPDAIAEVIKLDGVTHVLIYDTGLEFIKNQRNQFNDQDWILLDRFIQGNLTKIKEVGGAYSLYSVNAD